MAEIRRRGAMHASAASGAVVRGPALEQMLDERILTEPQILAMLDTVACHPRDDALIRLLHNGGLRVPSS